MGLSKSAYARHRGCSEGAVRKALRDGRIRPLPDGTIDPVEADAMWAANTAGHPTPTTTAARDKRTEPPAKPADYNEARARKEQANAELAELKVAELRGDLVRRDAVAKALFESARAVRDRLLSLPQRLAPVVLAETDQRSVEILLGDEIRRALLDLVPEEFAEAPE